jgi:hypothetical protein
MACGHGLVETLAHARTRAEGITAMTAHDIEPGRPPRGEPGCLPRGVACAGHVFAAHVRAEPGLVWAALTDPDQTEVDHADSPQDAEDVWLPVLAGLQLSVNPAL